MSAAAFVRPLRLLLGGCMLAVLTLGLYMVGPWNGAAGLYDHLGLAAMLGWALLPYALLGLLARRFSLAADARVYQGGALLLALGGLWAYADAALGHPDAQGGLVFVFAPLVQCTGLLVLLALCLLLRLVARARAGAAADQAPSRGGKR